MIKNINEYYKKKEEENSKFFSGEYRLNFYKVNDKNIVQIYLDNKTIYSEYQILGIIDKNLFIWSTNNMYIERDLTKIIEKIRNRVNNIEREKIRDYKDYELIYFMINNNFYFLEDEINLFMRICLYYSDGQKIILNKKNNSITEMIIITNILNISSN